MWPRAMNNHISCLPLIIKTKRNAYLLVVVGTKNSIQVLGKCLSPQLSARRNHSSAWLTAMTAPHFPACIVACTHRRSQHVALMRWASLHIYNHGKSHCGSFWGIRNNSGYVRPATFSSNLVKLTKSPNCKRYEVRQAVLDCSLPSRSTPDTAFSSRLLPSDCADPISSGPSSIALWAKPCDRSELALVQASQT